MAKKTVALALGSGGARGLSQIGIIEELVEQGYEIRAIAGTSIGALMGGLFAIDHLDEYKNWIIDLDKSDIFDLVDFTLNTQGFVKGDKVFNEMKKFIPTYKIEDLKIPFTAVSADLVSRQEIRISEGDLFQAIRASVAVPSVLTPFEKGDLLLVDGGVVNPLPITAIPENDAEITIAINLNGSNKYERVINEETKRSMEKKMWNSYIKNRFSLSFKQYFLGSSKSESSAKKKKKLNYFEIINDSFDLMQDKLTDVILKNETPDILVNIPRESASTFEFYRSLELIEYGREAMRKALKDYNEQQTNQK